jgi:hypothetical protein
VPPNACWQVLGASAAEVQEEMRGLADMYASLDLDALYSDPLCAVCGPYRALACALSMRSICCTHHYSESALLCVIPSYLYEGGDTKASESVRRMSALESPPYSPCPHIRIYDEGSCMPFSEETVMLISAVRVPPLT